MELLNRLDSTCNIVAFVNNTIDIHLTIMDFEEYEDYVCVYLTNGAVLRLSYNGIWVEPNKYYVSEQNTYIDFL